MGWQIRLTPFFWNAAMTPLTRKNSPDTVKIEGVSLPGVLESLQEKPMNISTAWSIAAIAYSLAGVGAAGLCWAIWRWAPRRRETFLLLSSLAMLDLQYGAAAADAFFRADQLTPVSFTVWAGAAQVLLALFWTFLILFLLAVVQRLQAPEVPDRSLVVGAIVGSSMLSGVTLFLFAFVIRDLLSGADTGGHQQPFGPAHAQADGGACLDIHTYTRHAV